MKLKEKKRNEMKKMKEKIFQSKNNESTNSWWLCNPNLAQVNKNKNMKMLY